MVGRCRPAPRRRRGRRAQACHADQPHRRHQTPQGYRRRDGRRRDPPPQVDALREEPGQGRQALLPVTGDGEPGHNRASTAGHALRRAALGQTRLEGAAHRMGSSAPGRAGRAGEDLRRRGARGVARGVRADHGPRPGPAADIRNAFRRAVLRARRLRSRRPAPQHQQSPDARWRTPEGPQARHRRPRASAARWTCP